MKKKIILTLAMTAMMTQATFAADATSSASTSTTTSKPTTSTSSNKNTSSSKTTSSKTTSSSKTTTATTSRSKVTPKAGDTKYVVQWGDTLNDIAAKYNTTAKTIADYNGIKDVNKIYAGEVIYIPAPKTTTVTPEKPVVTTPVTPEKPVVTPITPTVPVLPDAVTTPSITDDAAELAASLGTDGNWITCTTADVTVDELLVVDGEFHSKNDPNEKIYRKLALYTQDDDKKVTGEFNLNLNKGMEVNSPNFRIQNGTVNGDIIVNAPGFELKGATVNGNITFTSKEYQESALLTEGTVNGNVTTLVTPTVPVQTGMQDGTYVGINSEYSTSDKTDNWDYYVAIEVKDGKIVDVDWDGKNETVTTMTKDEYSEAGLYGMEKSSALGKTWHEQAEFVEAALVEHQTTDVFKLAEDGKHLASIDGVDTTASASIKVDEFIKYADQAIAKANGELPATATVDTISTASLTTDADTLVQSLSADGTWLTAAIGDVIVNEPIVVEGEFHSKGDENAAVYRKLTPSNHVYGEDGTTRDKTKEEFYVLTANEGMEVNSPNFNLVNGTFDGDIVVSAPGFTTSNMTILGDVTFTNQEARDTATFKNTNITGNVTPAVTGALKDGTYVGTTPIEADSKYQDQVTVVVKWGQVASVNYDPKVVKDGVATEVGKKELDSKGEYKMESTTGTWTEQAKVLENYALAGNTTAVDTVTGATISNAGFFAALNNALAQAK